MYRRAAIAILAAAVLVPGAQAQMKSAGGGARGFSRGSVSMGGRAGYAAGGRSMPMGGHFHGGAPGHSNGWVGNPNFHHHHNFGNKSFVVYNGCYNGYCGYGYPGYYVAPPIFYSGFDYGSSYDPGNYAAGQYVPATPAYDDTALQLQIQRLTDEVEQLRQEQQARNQPPPQAMGPARPNRMELPTVLVFRDGRVKEVSNYGIAGQTLWIFDEQRAKKVPLSDLDLAATRAANDDRGGFVLPK